jgi:type IV secretion system protein VirD4
MGFAGDLLGDVTSILINITTKIFSAIASLIAKLLGRVIIPQPDPQGDAKRDEFMTKHPIANIQVISGEKRGVFFGTQLNNYIIKPEEVGGHVLVCGGTGTGKSSCVAIPTLRNWRGSVFAIDIKGELHANTHQYRENIRVFDPEDEKSRYCYDPYFFLKESNNIAPEAFVIAQSIMPISPDVHEPFWIESAHNLLTGAILHYYSLGCSFIETLQRIQSVGHKTLIQIVADSPDAKAKLCAKSFTDMDAKVSSGITAEISKVTTKLVTDDNIIRALSFEAGKEIITPRDLEAGYDVYLKIPDYFMEQWKPLLTLMVNQFTNFLKRRRESPHNRPILLLLDEFAQLGKMPAMSNALSVLRSKKVTMCLIIQSIAQLDEIYRHDSRKVIADNCAFKAVLGATDPDTQEYFSRLVGTYEKVRATNIYGKTAYTGAPTGSSKSFAEGGEKRIVKREEFAYLQDIILLYPLPNNFCRVQKRPYYLEK